VKIQIFNAANHFLGLIFTSVEYENLKLSFIVFNCVFKIDKFMISKEGNSMIPNICVKGAIKKMYEPKWI